MKKVLRCLFIFSVFAIAGVTLFGCENSTALRTASFTDISISASKNYGVGVKFSEDKRLQEKYVDVQVKSDKVIDKMYIWEDNGEKYSLSFNVKDSWKSITTILVEGEEKAGTEQFEKYSEALSRRYLFSSSTPVNLTFRVVVGDVEDNSKGTGKVFVGSEPISDEFTLKVDAKENDNIED